VSFLFLDISFNRLERLHDLSRMRRLKRLVGAYNSFEELPEEQLLAPFDEVEAVESSQQ